MRSRARFLLCRLFPVWKRRRTRRSPAFRLPRNSNNSSNERSKKKSLIPTGDMPGNQTLFFLRMKKLPFGNHVEQIKEFGEGDCGGICAVDAALAGRPQRRNGKSHGDAMVSPGVNLSAMKLLASSHVESIFELFNLSTHCAQIGGNEGNAIRLLDAQLSGVANANALPCIGRNGGENRELVDQLRCQRAGDGGGSEAFARGIELNRADEFAVLLFEIQNADARAE